MFRGGLGKILTNELKDGIDKHYNATDCGGVAVPSVASIWDKLQRNVCEKTALSTKKNITKMIANFRCTVAVLARTKIGMTLVRGQSSDGCPNHVADQSCTMKRLACSSKDPVTIWLKPSET